MHRTSEHGVFSCDWYIHNTTPPPKAHRRESMKIIRVGGTGVCCEIVSPKNDSEASPMLWRHYGCLNRTWRQTKNEGGNLMGPLPWTKNYNQLSSAAESRRNSPVLPPRVHYVGAGFGIYSHSAFFFIFHIISRLLLQKAISSNGHPKQGCWLSKHLRGWRNGLVIESITTFAEDLSPVPHIHVGPFTTIYNSS